MHDLDFISLDRCHALLILKPPGRFTSNGTMKALGLHITETETPLTFPVITYGILILTYLTLRSQSFIKFQFAFLKLNKFD